jgi:heme/copper-type cytochrome/quinol oxidase subunit 2
MEIDELFIIIFISLYFIVAFVSFPVIIMCCLCKRARESAGIEMEEEEIK